MLRSGYKITDLPNRKDKPCHRTREYAWPTGGISPFLHSNSAPSYFKFEERYNTWFMKKTVRKISYLR